MVYLRGSPRECQSSDGGLRQGREGGQKKVCCWAGNHCGQLRSIPTRDLQEGVSGGLGAAPPEGDSIPSVVD